MYHPPMRNALIGGVALLFVFAVTDPATIVAPKRVLR